MNKISAYLWYETKAKPQQTILIGYITYMPEWKVCKKEILQILGRPIA
jgi:hypothetical protein